MVTREQARWPAEGYIRKNKHLEYTDLYRAYSLEEIPFRLPFLYGVSDESLSRAWIAYCKPQPCTFGDSTVIVVSKDTGKVIYAGSAYDEG